ncbi:hypothetical protein E2F47_09345 [Mycobacterium eburneum]|nr:hypothetical protein E2F47_09345 [Mycobacterium eburneum]
MSVVQTRSGAVRGVEVDGVWAWRGIPYAAPPVGELRWAAPHREPPWSGVRDGAGAVAQAYAERYPQLSPTQRRHVFMTDERYGAPTLRLLDGQSQHAPVWSFRFKAPSEGAGADVPYGFGLAGSADPAIDALSEGIQQALASFRRTGAPYSPRLPELSARRPRHPAAGGARRGW